jgi:sugar (pentulose or hexulose) kinase
MYIMTTGSSSTVQLMPIKFPEVVPCTAVLGTLTKEATEALNLSTSVQVVAGSIDNTAASIGSGAVDINSSPVYRHFFLDCHSCAA